MFDYIIISMMCKENIGNRVFFRFVYKIEALKKHRVIYEIDRFFYKAICQFIVTEPLVALTNNIL